MSIDPTRSASTIGRFTQLRNAYSTSTNALPVFRRVAAEQGKMPTLRSLGVAEGRKPSNSEVKQALTGDLLRIVRDLRAGDLAKANAKLHEMKGTMPKNFLLQNHLNPRLISVMGKEMLLAPDARTALGLVLKRLETEGVSKWHPQLSVSKPPSEG